MTVTDNTSLQYTDITDSSFAKKFLAARAAEGYDPEWFDKIYQVGEDTRCFSYTFKKEHAAKAEKLSNQQIEDLNLKEAKEIDTSLPKLSKEQWNYLSNKYDPKDMTKEQYYDFIGELNQLGVISDKEKDYLGFKFCSLPPPFTVTISQVTTTLDPPFDISSCKGNVYELARYHSEIEFRRIDSYRTYRSAQALSFEKLLKIFEKMGVR